MPVDRTKRRMPPNERLHRTDLDNLVTNLRGEVGEIIRSSMESTNA